MAAMMTRQALLLVLLVSGAAGQSIACFDVRGTPVTLVKTQIPDIGQAAIYQGRPVILFNALFARRLPSAVVTFFLYHECAHHALGHTLGAGMPLTREQAADCWAVRKLFEIGQFDDESVETVQATIARLGRADWTHLPGPMRAINLRRCLTDGPAIRVETRGEAGCPLAPDLVRYIERAPASELRVRLAGELNNLHDAQRALESARAAGDPGREVRIERAEKNVCIEAATIRMIEGRLR
jgi:hypothetical protein